MGKIILSLLVMLWAFEAQALVYFINGEDGIKFSKQSYGCNEGWHMAGSKCVKNVCSSTVYPFSAQPDMASGSIIICKSGDDKFYGYSSCNEGWNLNSGKCELNNCNAYPHKSKPDTTLGTVISCKSGPDTYYAYSSCILGYELSNNICVESCKYTATSAPANCATKDNCKIGTKTYYGCKLCNTGWYVNDTFGCTLNNCTGYANTDCDLSRGLYSSCQSGNVLYCNYYSCNSGYELESKQCVKVYEDTCVKEPFAGKDLDTYNSASINCKEMEGCTTKQGDNLYMCSSCNGTCQTLDNGYCSYIYPGEEYLWGVQPWFYTGCDTTHGTMSHYCDTEGGRIFGNEIWGGEPIGGFNKRCKYSSCASGYSLKDGMCWCEGNYPYYGRDDFDPSSLANSYSKCTDLGTHVNVQEWKKITSWKTIGSLQVSIVRGGNYPISMFEDYCKSNGAHLITETELTGIYSTVRSECYDCAFIYAPYLRESSDTVRRYDERVQVGTTLSYYWIHEGWSGSPHDIAYDNDITICVKN